VHFLHILTDMCIKHSKGLGLWCLMPL
jgi:hypothetical protein